MNNPEINEIISCVGDIVAGVPETNEIITCAGDIRQNVPPEKWFQLGEMTLELHPPEDAEPMLEPLPL